MLPLGGGGETKPWGLAAGSSSFPCCWGTLSETFAKLADSLYFRSPDNSTLFVNMFASSTITFANGRRVQQLAGFPTDPRSTTTITVVGVAPPLSSSFSTYVGGGGEWTIALRVPFWATGGHANTVSVNGGAPIPTSQIVPSSYLLLTQAWKVGDTIKVHFPMAVRFEQLDDSRPQFAGFGAFFYGPLLLAGMTNENVLLLANASSAAVNQVIVKNSSTTKPGELRFEASLTGCGKTEKVTMIPFNDVRNANANALYTVYWYTKQRPPPAHSVPTGTAELTLGSKADFNLVGGASVVANDGGRQNQGYNVDPVVHADESHHDADGHKVERSGLRGQHRHHSATHAALANPLYMRGPSQTGGYNIKSGNHYAYGDDGDISRPQQTLNLRSGQPHTLTSAAMAAPFVGPGTLTSITFTYQFVVGFTQGKTTGSGAKVSLGYDSDVSCPASGGNATVLYTSPRYLTPSYDKCKACYSDPVHVNVTGLELTAEQGGSLVLLFDNGDRNLQILLPLNISFGWTQ